MNKSESIAELSKALAQFQKEVKQPAKDKVNPFLKSKYVPLENVVEAIMDVAPKYGLSFTQWALNDDSGKVGVTTLLLHESGEYIQYDPIFMIAEKNTPQGLGSLITYLKRYTLSAIFGITSDDDDDAIGANNNDKNDKKQVVSSEHITPKQLGLIKTKSMEFAELRNQKVEAVYKHLKISSLETLTQKQAQGIIKQLDAWIHNAKKVDAEK